MSTRSSSFWPEPANFSRRHSRPPLPQNRSEKSEKIARTFVAGHTSPKPRLCNTIQRHSATMEARGLEPLTSVFRGRRKSGLTLAGAMNAAGPTRNPKRATLLSRPCSRVKATTSGSATDGWARGIVLSVGSSHGDRCSPGFASMGVVRRGHPNPPVIIISAIPDLSSPDPARAPDAGGNACPAGVSSGGDCGDGAKPAARVSPARAPAGSSERTE